VIDTTGLSEAGNINVMNGWNRGEVERKRWSKAGGKLFGGGGIENITPFMTGLVPWAEIRSRAQFQADSSGILKKKWNVCKMCVLRSGVRTGLDDQIRDPL